MKAMDITLSYLDEVIRPRAAESTKETYGRVVAVCGSSGYTGAAYLAAQGAVRTGSGVVTLCTPENVYPILAAKLNEAVVVPVGVTHDGQISHAGAQKALRYAEKAKALLIGCGLGRNAETGDAVRKILQGAACPVILDADGINALEGHIDVLRSINVPVILTPHKGEFSRITGISRAEIMPEHAAAFAKETGCIVLLKSHRTLIAAPDGTLFRNTTGNPGMAKGGSGDVLAGIILSLCGQGLAPVQAACAGAFLHGAAGDRCANAIGEYGMTPTDMLEAIAAILRRYNTREW